MRQKSLTAKEIEVLRAIAVHGTIAAAARSLGVSPHTVDAHLDHVRDKSGYRFLTQMVAWAAVNGWLLPLRLVEARPQEAENSPRRARRSSRGTD